MQLIGRMLCSNEENKQNQLTLSPHFLAMAGQPIFSSASNSFDSDVCSIPTSRHQTPRPHLRSHWPSNNIHTFVHLQAQTMVYSGEKNIYKKNIVWVRARSPQPACTCVCCGGAIFSNTAYTWPWQHELCSENTLTARSQHTDRAVTVQFAINVSDWTPAGRAPDHMTTVRVNHAVTYSRSWATSCTSKPT